MRFGEEGEIELKTKLADLDTKEILSPEWQEKVTGILHGDIEVERKTGFAARTKGTLHLTKGVIEGLGVLAELQRRDPSQRGTLPIPDKIVKAEVLRKRDHAYKPTKVGS